MQVEPNTRTVSSFRQFWVPQLLSEQVDVFRRADSIDVGLGMFGNLGKKESL